MELRTSHLYDRSWIGNPDTLQLRRASALANKHANATSSNEFMRGFFQRVNETAIANGVGVSSFSDSDFFAGAM